MISMRYLFIICCCCLSVTGRAQYSRSFITRQADSIARQLLGSEMHAFAIADEDINYNYLDESGQEQTGSFMDADTFTVRNTVKMFVGYELHYPYEKCPAKTVVEGSFTIVLDKDLKLAEQPDLSFIPGYVLKGDSCGLIAQGKALAIAASDGFQGQGTSGQPDCVIENMEGDGGYQWRISGNRKASDGQDAPFETMTIDAQTGVILAHLLNGGPVK